MFGSLPWSALTIRQMTGSRQESDTELPAGPSGHSAHAPEAHRRGTRLPGQRIPGGAGLCGGARGGMSSGRAEGAPHDGRLLRCCCLHYACRRRVTPRLCGPQANLPAAAVGMNQAMQRKWIKMEKSSGRVMRAVRTVPMCTAVLPDHLGGPPMNVAMQQGAC